MKFKNVKIGQVVKVKSNNFGIYNSAVGGDVFVKGAYAVVNDTEHQSYSGELEVYIVIYDKDGDVLRGDWGLAADLKLVKEGEL